MCCFLTGSDTDIHSRELAAGYLTMKVFDFHSMDGQAAG